MLQRNTIKGNLFHAKKQKQVKIKNKKMEKNLIKF